MYVYDCMLFMYSRIDILKRFSLIHIEDNLKNKDVI
jgi:hypothetical protein